MKNIKKTVFIDDVNIQNVFSDIIEVSINNETARFKIALKGEDGNTAKTTHNIIITLPHFLRLSEAIKNTSDELYKRIKSTEDDINI